VLYQVQNSNDYHPVVRALEYDEAVAFIAQRKREAPDGSLEIAKENLPDNHGGSLPKNAMAPAFMHGVTIVNPMSGSTTSSGSIRLTAMSGIAANSRSGKHSSWIGHYAAYRAMELACDLARETGMAGVGVRRSSHLGAAGAYALAGAEQGFISFATTNTDSMVPLFGGATAFHGTNPLAFAAPLAGQKPWLLDMATSSIPMNRVLLYRSLGKELPGGVAADRSGVPTTNAHEAEMVLPLGGLIIAIRALRLRA